MPDLVRAPTRAYLTPLMDNRRWDAFEPRDGDIVVATYAKCGTTWMQRIVDLLVHQSPEVRPVGDLSPWLDATFFNPIEADLATLRRQTHRRYVKSHAPFDALPVWDGVKYIHVGRDGRDARLSWHNHLAGFKPEFARRIIANTIRLAGGEPPAEEAPTTRAAPAAAPAPPTRQDLRAFVVQWLDLMEAASPDPPRVDPPFFEFEATYWRERMRPNLLLVHYDDLNADLEAEMRRISAFLEIDTPRGLMPALVEAARFSSMKARGDEIAPGLMLAFDRGADRFLNEGRSGRWREILEPEDVARYVAVAAGRASPALAAWLEHGRRVAGEPREAAD